VVGGDPPHHTSKIILFLRGVSAKEVQPPSHSHRLLKMSTRLDELTKINGDDLLAAFGLAGVRRGRAVVQRACRRPARRLASQVLAYDVLVAAAGLQAGAAWALGQYVRHAVVEGQQCIPRSGTLLIVSNHPGLYDTVALFATIPRADLRVVAADRPFLRALTHTSRYLITLGDAPTDRMAGVRSSVRHLRAGGALLTFPGGRIEPDPAVMPGAVAALNEWSESLSVFVRLVPELTIVPVIVSGVLSSAALRHPLARLRGRRHHHLLAATLQVMFPSLQNGTLRVAFGRPMGADQLGTSASAAIIAECRRLIEQSARAAAC
jgi:putative hemolysin